MESNDRQHGYFNGDEIEYTGIITAEGYREFVYVEGHRKGEFGVDLTKAEKDSNLARNRAVAREMQEGFKRLAGK